MMLTVADVAAELRCSPSLVYRRIAEGALPARRLGDGPKAPLRIARRDLDAYLNRHVGPR